jgi:hypothetical protein
MLGMEIVVDDRRLVSRVRRHWEAAAADRKVPSKHDIRPWLVGDDWSNCVLVRFAPMLDQWIFAVIGEGLRPSGSQILAGDPIADCPGDTFLGLTLSFLPRVTASGTYFLMEGSTTILADGPILYRSILLPLSDNGGKTIDAVLGAANFRKIGEERSRAPSAVNHPERRLA